MSSHHLSFGGVLHPADTKKFEETILLVPFFDGEKVNLKKHWEFLNELGFDAVVFDLFHGPWKGGPLPLASDGSFGMKHVWADQIEQLLNEITGPKFVFSFSNPSASAIEAISRRNSVDIKGLVCDSGPSGKFWNSMNSFFIHERPIRFPPLRWMAATLSSAYWNPRMEASVHEDLETFPKRFPVLSIRGWRDPLVPPEAIDKVFEPHTQLDWRRVSLPEGRHLNGLRDFPNEYRPAVERFLREFSTPTKA